MEELGIDMTNTTEKAPKDMVIIMEGDLTVNRAGEVRRLLLGALDASVSVVIGFKENCRADVSFLQIVCAAYRSALDSGKHLKLDEDIPVGLLNNVLSNGFGHYPVWAPYGREIEEAKE